MAEVAISIGLAGASAALDLLFAPKPRKPTPIDRGKLDDPRFSLPALGEAVPKGWGTLMAAPIWIDMTPTLYRVEVTEGQDGGKGGGGTAPTPDERKHIYTKSLIGVYHNGLVHKGVSRMWFNRKLVYNADFATNEATTSATRYEAEHGVLGGGASVATQAECSGGKKVTGLGSGGHVTINCDVDSAASYEIGVYYTSTADRTFKISVNGGGLNDLFCPSSGGAGEVTSEVITLSLLSGANTIKFENSGAACPDLDRIDIVPALVFTPEGVDRRGFTGVTRPGQFGPSNADFAWSTTNEMPTFSEAEGGVTNGGFFQATLAEWGNPTIRFYNGSELQDADPILIALRGLDLAPGYRGLGIIAIDNLQLLDGQPPNVELEIQQGVREVPAIVRDIYHEVGVGPENLDLTALESMVLGDSSGFDPGTYGAISWTGTSNATGGAGGAIHKTSGTTNTWNAYASSGTTVAAGADASIRFTPDAGTFMIGFGYTATPSGALPHPYDQVPFAVLCNLNSNPSQESRNAIQLSLGGSNNTFDVGVWSPGDKFQVEYRNGRFAAYQNGLMLTGYTPPVPSTFPLQIVYAGYATGGGASAASFAAGANVGTEPIVANGGGLFMVSPRPAGELIVELMTRFQFDLPEVDGVVKAVRRDSASDLTIPYEETRAYRGDSRPESDMIIRRVDPLTLPQLTSVTYSDPGFAYQTRTQSEPRLFGPQRGRLDVTLQMIETAQNMKNLAITLANRMEVEGQTYDLTLGPKYMRIHQGTVLTLPSRSGVTHTVRVKELELEMPAGIVTVEAVRQDASVFTSNGAPHVGEGLENPIVAVPGNTKGVIIDGPLLRPEDAGDGTQPVVYVAMCGRGSGAWPAGFLFKEFPAGSGNHTLITTSDKPSGIGVTTGALASVADSTTWDLSNTLTINFYSNTQLESVTQDEVLNHPELNLLGVRNPVTGDVEYLQFVNATAEVAAAPFITKYTVSTLLRGRALTEYAIGTHTSADDVVVIDSSVLPRRFSLSDIDHDLVFRFVTVGQFVDRVPSITQRLFGNSLKLPSIVNPRGTRDSGNDLLIEFEGRSRVGGGLRSSQAGALNEEEEVYKVQVLNSGSTTLPNGNERIMSVIPGMQQAAVLTSAVGFTNIDHNTITGQTAAYSVQQVHGPDNFVEATLRARTSAFFLSAIALVKVGTVLEYLDFGDEFPLPNKLPSSVSVLPYLVVLETFTLGQQRLRVWEYGTQIFSASDDSAEDDYDPNFGWHSLGGSDTMFRVRFNFVGSTVRIQKASAVAVPLTTIVTGTRPSEFPVFLYGIAGSANYQVQNAILTTYPFPKTIYSAAQQAEDGFTPGDSVEMDIWQFSRLTGDGFKTRVTL